MKLFYHLNVYIDNSNNKDTSFIITDKIFVLLLPVSFFLPLFPLFLWPSCFPPHFHQSTLSSSTQIAFTHHTIHFHEAVYLCSVAFQGRHLNGVFHN